MVEATASYEWFVQWVEPAADRVVLAHPGKLRVLAGVVFFVVADVRAGVVDVVVVIVAGLLRDGAQSPTENAAKPLPGAGSQRLRRRPC